jgi:hypothetical protein
VGSEDTKSITRQGHLTAREQEQTMRELGESILQGVNIPQYCQGNTECQGEAGDHLSHAGGVQSIKVDVM